MSTKVVTATVAAVKQEPAWTTNLKNAALCDETATRGEYFFRSPEFLVKLLKVKDVDRPLWYCLFNAGVFNAIQLALLPFSMNAHWALVALPTICKLALFALPRYVLALHFTAHVPCMNPHWLNLFYTEWLLNPLYGLPPGSYSYHHVIMHHREDNITPKDLSSTMPYQRDSMLHFLHYWARFYFCGWFELPQYLWCAGYKRGACILAFGMCLWFALQYAVWCIRPAFMLWLFTLPHLVLSMLFMFGNFSQHMFIDAEDFKNDHLLTVNMLNSEYNRLTFNDGYHILHHKYPICHWATYPQRFVSDKELRLHSEAKKAVCFREIDYWWLGVYVMTGQLKKLSTYFMPCSEYQAQLSEDEIVAFFKAKLKPVGKEFTVVTRNSIVVAAFWIAVFSYLYSLSL